MHAVTIECDPPWLLFDDAEDASTFNGKLCVVFADSVGQAETEVDGMPSCSCLIGVVVAIECSGLFIPDVSEVADELVSTTADTGGDETGLVNANGVCVAVTGAVVVVASGAFDGPLSEARPTVAASLISAVVVTVVSSFSILTRLFAGWIVDNEASPVGDSVTLDDGFRFKLSSCLVIGTCSAFETIDDAFEQGSTPDEAFSSALPPSGLQLVTTSIALACYRWKRIRHPTPHQ
mmetsp:Transcript_8419/g.20710  ORF Transcript_8419/g.20710 Transcript_8419/m.20710 type:complete len:235 (-) Transcript_8419:220-924(-)